MSTEKLIDALQSGNTLDTNNAFKDAINSKLVDAISAKKVEVASNLITRTGSEEE